MKKEINRLPNQMEKHELNNLYQILEDEHDRKRKFHKTIFMIGLVFSFLLGLLYFIVHSPFCLIGIFLCAILLILSGIMMTLDF